MFTIEAAGFSYTVGDDGKNLAFIDRKTGENHIADSYCAVLTDCEKKEHFPVNASMENGIISVTFENGTVITTEVEVYEEFVTFTLKSASNEDFHAVAFVNIEVATDYSKYSLDAGIDGFTAGLMGLTVSTRMAEHPGRNTRLRAEGYPHIGLFSTKRSPYPVKAAVIGTMDSHMRDVMKAVLEIVPDGELPKTKLGGPYGYDAVDARRTYTTRGAVGLKDIHGAIADMKRLGIRQASFHQGVPYSQGDFVTNREMYPGGIEELKKVIDIYHENDMLVSLHTYTFFVSHDSKYVTPVPHPDLDHIAEVTLTRSLNETDTTVYVDTLDQVAKVYSGALVSSAYIVIGQELIRFGGVDEERCAFINCERGAQGTSVSAHEAGSLVCQLKERFCYLAPRAGSDLFYEVAKNTAEFYNECGFDAFYLDAIDGVYALEGNDYAWYHAMDFINEMFKYLKTDPIFDCCYNPQYTGSWYARSRYGALDAAKKAHRDYIDAHIDYDNRTAERMYLVPELGWYDLYSETKDYGWQDKLITTDDVEYLCSKIIGTDCTMSYRKASIFDRDIHPMLDRYSEIVRFYDRARYSGQITPELRLKLREPEAEFKLKEKDGIFTFHKSRSQMHKFENLEERGTFTYENPYETQIPSLRLESLYAASNYEEDGIVLQEFDENEPVANDMLYTVDSQGLIDSHGKDGVGVWVYGDGSGVSMRIRLQNRLVDEPRRKTEFYVKCDFVGWRYFAFYEGQNGEPSHEDWPRVEMVYKVFTDVSEFYGFYRDGANYSQLSFLRITLNTDQPTGIRLRSIKLLPYHPNVLKNPTVTINGTPITFHCELKPKTWLELRPDGSCEVLDFCGFTVERPEYTGGQPVLQAGENEISLSSEERPEHLKRAAVTLRVVGEPI